MLVRCAMWLLISSVRIDMASGLLADNVIALHGMKLVFHFSGQLCWRLNEYSFQA